VNFFLQHMRQARELFLQHFIVLKIQLNIHKPQTKITRMQIHSQRHIKYGSIWSGESGWSRRTFGNPEGYAVPFGLEGSNQQV